MTTRTRVKTPGIYEPSLVPSRTLTLMSKASKSIFKLPLPTLWKRITDVKTQTRAWSNLSDSVHMLMVRAKRLKPDELFAAYLTIGTHHSIWLINSGNALKIVPSDSGFQVVQYAWLDTFVVLLKFLNKFVYKLNPSVYHGESQPYVSIRAIDVLRPFFNSEAVDIKNVIESLRKMPTLVIGDVLWEGRLLSPQFDVINEDELQQMVRKPMKSRLLTYNDYLKSERTKLEGLDTPIPRNSHPRVPLPTQDRLLKLQKDSNLFYTQLTLKNAVEKEKKLRNNLIPTSTKAPKRRAPNAPEKTQGQRRRHQAPAPKTNRPAWR